MYKSVITCDVKEVAPRVLRFTGSDESPDRVGDVIKAEGWQLENYLKNPVVMWTHDYSQPPVGRAVNVEVKGKKLIFDVEFAPPETYQFADTIYRLYKGGFLKASSVGFNPLDWEGKSSEDEMPHYGGNVFTRQELLELSAVPVPANPNALVHAKSVKAITAKELKVLAKAMDAWADLDIANAPVIDLTVAKPEENEETIRVPVPKEEGKHEGHKMRTITISEDEGIKALFCVDDRVNITYLFDSEKWTMDEAKKWVEEHSKDKKEVSQAEIGDELAYCLALVKAGDFNEDNKVLLNDLYLEIWRLTGCDKPEDITVNATGVIDDTSLAATIRQSLLKPDEPSSDEVFEAVKKAIKEIKEI